MSAYRVTVFGGANPIPGEPAYEEALRLGHLLAEAGFVVLTGGYIGTMEAVSRGASEAGGHVIGVTCTEIEIWRKVTANRWVKEERRYERLRERLLALIDDCDAALALPGGPGTLAEVALMWNHLLVDAIPPRPLILVGWQWQAVIEQFYHSMGTYYIPAGHRKWLIFATTADEALEALKQNLLKC